MPSPLLPFKSSEAFSTSTVFFPSACSWFVSLSLPDSSGLSALFLEPLPSKTPLLFGCSFIFPFKGSYLLFSPVTDFFLSFSFWFFILASSSSASLTLAKNFLKKSSIFFVSIFSEILSFKISFIPFSANLFFILSGTNLSVRKMFLCFADLIIFLVSFE